MRCSSQNELHLENVFPLKINHKQHSQSCQNISSFEFKSITIHKTKNKIHLKFIIYYNANNSYFIPIISQKLNSPDKFNMPMVLSILSHKIVRSAFFVLSMCARCHCTCISCRQTYDVEPVCVTE